MASNHENVIREKRSNLAAKNNLTGPSGKFGVILQAFGEPILRQGTGLVDANWLEDPYQDISDIGYEQTVSGQKGPIAWEDKLHDASDDYLYNEGLSFSGLSRGMQIDIVQLNDINQISVTYKGHLVYREIAGELDAYVPLPEWEDLIEKLYRTAKEKLKKFKIVQTEQIAAKVEEKKQSFLQKLRTRWGI